MYLNLRNAKFSIIDVENKVYGEVILSLHFSISFFNMILQLQSGVSVKRAFSFLLDLWTNKVTVKYLFVLSTITSQFFQRELLL